MTNISKKGLSQEEFQSLFDRMDTFVAKLSVKNSTDFFEELLGNEERVMLAKRLAAIVMCIEGCSIYRISQSLKISPSTAERIHDAYTNGAYLKIERLFARNQDDFEDFCRTLEVILRAGLPPRAGRNRAHFWFKKLPRTK